MLLSKESQGYILEQEFLDIGTLDNLDNYLFRGVVMLDV